jgi:hypothetical protein
MGKLSTPLGFGNRLLQIVEVSFDRYMDACYHFQIASVSQLKRYIAEQNFPAAAVFVAIARYGYSVNWLLTGEGSMFADTEAGRVRKVEVLHRLQQRGQPDAGSGWGLPEELRAAAEWKPIPTVEADGKPYGSDTNAAAGASSVSEPDSSVTTPGEGRRRGRTKGPSNVT